jgi:hypothetical protein
MVSNDFGILQLENMMQGYPFTTAMERENASFRLKCFFCQQWFDLSKSELGNEVDCPICRKKMRVN